MRDLHKTSKGERMDRLWLEASEAEPNPEPTRHGEASQDGLLEIYSPSHHCLRLLRSPCPSTHQANQGLVDHSDHVIYVFQMLLLMGGFRSAEGQ